MQSIGGWAVNHALTSLNNITDIQHTLKEQHNSISRLSIACNSLQQYIYTLLYIYIYIYMAGNNKMVGVIIAYLY